MADDLGLQTNVLYFTMPNEDFAALIRRVTFTNLGSVLRRHCHEQNVRLNIPNATRRVPAQIPKSRWILKFWTVLHRGCRLAPTTGIWPHRNILCAPHPQPQFSSCHSQPHSCRHTNLARHLKNMGRTLEAWMNVYNMKNSSHTLPFAHLSMGLADTAQVAQATTRHRLNLPQITFPTTMSLR